MNRPDGYRFVRENPRGTWRCYEVQAKIGELKGVTHNHRDAQLFIGWDSELGGKCEPVDLHESVR